MTNKQILQADMLDILFEHRNKLYGAYALRKTYSKRLGVALATALFVVFLFIMMSFIKKDQRHNSSLRNDSTMTLTEVDLTKPDEPKPIPKPEVKPPQAEVDYQSPVIVKDILVDDVLPTTDDIENADVGDKNADGQKPDGTIKATVETIGSGNDQKTQNEEVNEPDLPSHPPEFPGGTRAWLAFLQRYLQSPEDIEPGQRIDVLVRFWVDVDGSVSKPEIIKSGGASFDKEVIRVLKKMPKWEPAVQHGSPVAVGFTQPVIFVGVEE